MNERTHKGMYGRLLGMTAISFVVMYGLMYAMVDALPNVLNNLNQVYMAGLMASAMALIELAVMRPMYPDKKQNFLIGSVGMLALIGFWLAIRYQAGIGDKQFLRSMIPHHASAILMCNEASIEDPELKKLCEGIVSSQSSEIAQMKALLGRGEGR
jgi:uncharacterized protein (DUF305 family)